MYTKKMISRQELKVLKVFKENLFREFSIRDIMKISKKNSYNWVFNSIKKFFNLGLLIFRESAGIKLYSINWDNVLVFRYFSIIDYSNGLKIPYKNIFELINSSPVKYFSLIVGGSYAKGTNNKKSDLDVLIIVENKSEVQKVLSILTNKADLMIPKIDLFVFSKKEFLEMLLNKEENLGKQFFETGLVLFGSESYYLILKEAKERGFRG